MKHIEEKIRIQRFTPDFDMIDDRLVTQVIELRTGPKEVHKGPLKIEFSLFSQEACDNAIAYLQKIRGVIPLEAAKIKKIKPSTFNDNREEFLKSIRNSTEIKTTEDLLKFLRDNGFVMVNTDFLKTQEYEWKTTPSDQRVFMIRLLKEAKNPVNNKYDPQLVFGFRMDEATAKLNSGLVSILLYGDKGDPIKLQATGGKINIKRPEMLKFPYYMNQEERDKWRMEYYKRQKNTSLEKSEKSKFYLRWETDVMKMNSREKKPVKKLVAK